MNVVVYATDAHEQTDIAGEITFCMLFFSVEPSANPCAQCALAAHVTRWR